MFQEKVRHGFRQLQKAEPGRVKLIDGSRPIKVIQLEIQSIFMENLKIST